jgi:hypothetical protein
MEAGGLSNRQPRPGIGELVAAIFERAQLFRGGALFDEVFESCETGAWPGSGAAGERVIVQAC